MYYLDTKNDQSFFNSFKDEVLFFYETIAAHN